MVPRIRWRWFADLLRPVAFVALVATLVVSALLPAQDSGAEVGGHLNDCTPRPATSLLVILLLTPLQAAGEEYAFRGYLTQAFGGLFGSRGAAVLFPAGALRPRARRAGRPDLHRPVRLRAGRRRPRHHAPVASRPGIAMHVLNNFLAFGLALGVQRHDLGAEPDRRHLVEPSR